MFIYNDISKRCKIKFAGIDMMWMPANG